MSMQRASSYCSLRSAWLQEPQTLLVFQDSSPSMLTPMLQRKYDTAQTILRKRKQKIYTIIFFFPLFFWKPRTKECARVFDLAFFLQRPSSWIFFVYNQTDDKKKEIIFAKKGDWLHHVGPKKNSNFKYFFLFWLFSQL